MPNAGASVRQPDKQAKLEKLKREIREKRELAERAEDAALGIDRNGWTWFDDDVPAVFRRRVDADWGDGCLVAELNRLHRDGRPEDALSAAQRAAITWFDRETKAVRRAVLDAFRDRWSSRRGAADAPPLRLVVARVCAQDHGFAPIWLSLRGSRFDDGEHGLAALIENHAVTDVGDASLLPSVDWAI